jgi:hypothetical protein
MRMYRAKTTVIFQVPVKDMQTLVIDERLSVKERLNE